MTELTEATELTLTSDENHIVLRVSDAQVLAEANDAPAIQIDLTQMDIVALEELSYDLARRASETQNAMWLVLHHIKITGKWTATHQEWEDYAKDWLLEATRRCGGQLTYSLREAQQRLSNIKRLGWAGLAPELAVRGSSDVMAKLTRRLGTWDLEGTLKDVDPLARTNLDAAYPGLELKDQIRRLAEDVASVGIHKEALEVIERTLGVETGTVSYDFAVLQDADTGIQIQCQRVVWDPTTAEAQEQRYFRSGEPGEPWPDDAVLALRRLVSRTVRV